MTGYLIWSAVVVRCFREQNKEKGYTQEGRPLPHDEFDAWLENWSQPGDADKARTWLFYHADGGWPDEYPPACPCGECVHSEAHQPF